MFYREALPTQDLPGAPPVILIHGSGDSSKWWENIGTFGLGAAAGHRVIGLDLPGMNHIEAPFGNIVEQAIAVHHEMLFGFFRGKVGHS